MTRQARRAIALAGVAVLGAAWFAWLPPRALTLPPAGSTPPAVRGAIHVHTRRSDGSGTVEEVAAAAARAGLKFVVFTDHGDASREPETPRYRDGVLCIDAVEISTAGGHLVAIGLPRAPYPLGGEPRDVVDDVHRLGGVAIAAHPESPRAELQWRDWAPPLDGVEWLNADSEWRDQRPLELARVLLTYPLRPTEALALLLDRPTAALRRWESLTRQRRVFTVAGADAHARLRLRGSGEPYDSTPSLHLPGYESSFRTFSNVLPQVRLTGDARADAAAVIGAIAAGHSFTAVDGLATPGTLSFSAESGGRHAESGDAITAQGSVTLRVSSNAPGDATTTLFRDGVVVATAAGGTLMHEAGAERAAYRVEVQLANGRPTTAPWLVSNPIYVGDWGRAEDVPQPAAAREAKTIYQDGAAAAWTIEKSARAAGALDVIRSLPGTQLLLRYGLGGTADEGPYVAAAVPAGGELARFDGVSFEAHSDKPMRLSVQVRAANSGERWRRSVYLDTTPRTIYVAFAAMSAVEPGSPVHPDLASVGSLLFVVDTVNARPGGSGQVWLDAVKLVR